MKYDWRTPFLPESETVTLVDDNGSSHDATPLAEAFLKARRNSLRGPVDDPPQVKEQRFEDQKSYTMGYFEAIATLYGVRALNVFEDAVETLWELHRGSGDHMLDFDE